LALKLKTSFNMASGVVAIETGAGATAGAAAAGPRRVVLLGNPNVGKSALFNALTGLRATVSNYPGTTVEVYRGRLAGGSAEIVDSPGLNSLLPLSEDEQVTSELVRSVRGDEGSVVVQVADAKNLRRALLLTLQLGQLEVPTMLVLNMHDEAEARGIRLDLRGLERELGIPVRATVATAGRGLDGVMESLALARVPQNHVPIPEDVAAPALALLSGAEAPPATPPAFVARYHESLLAHADAIARRYATEGVTTAARVSRSLGRVAIHPVWGWPVLAAVLLAMYEFVGIFGAGTLVGLMEEGLFHGYLNPWAKAALAPLPWAFVRDLLVGEYGLVTMGLSYGLAIVLPIVLTFFTAFALLEDSGYLPRLAVMSDRVFRLMGLNGKAVLPMVLGLGCDTMATMTTRILETRKDRLLVTLLLALGVPCSAQLGVIMGMIAYLPPAAVAVWGAVVTGVMFAVGWAASRLIPGERSDFILELPPIRVPQLGNIVIKTVARLEWYLKEVLPLFALGTLLLFVLDRTGALHLLERWAAPLVEGGLGLPRATTAAFIVGFLRRDYGAAGLFALARAGALSVPQVLVSLVVVTLFVPCIANVLVIVREHGARVGLWVVGFVFPFAFAVGVVLRFGMLAFGVHF
jgi:ferrous iron transport protein B